MKERGKKKRVHTLVVATKRWKVLSKVLTVVDALKEEEHVTPLKRLEILRPQMGLTRPSKVAHFTHLSPRRHVGQPLIVERVGDAPKRELYLTLR
jgi:hypothetical protein